MTKMMNFMRVSLRNPHKIGAIVPSSEELAMAMVKNIRLRNGETLIELGPGSGAITAQIRKSIPDASAYLGIEREPVFVERLERQYPGLAFINGKAESSVEICQQEGLFHVKAIICSLPFANMKSNAQDSIIENIAMLMTPGCVFRTYQYALSYPLPMAIRFRQKLTQLFGPPHRSKIVYGNIPPALVLTWSRPLNGSLTIS
jgi:phospholipid N-methyltransferase